MPSDRKERLPHIILPKIAHSTRHTSPAGGGGSKFNAPARNRQQHAAALLEQLNSASNAISEIKSQRESIGLDAVSGVYLNFESEPGFDLKFESLENRPSGIELLSLKTEGDKHIATVFVPDDKIQFFLKRVTQYRDEDGVGKKPKPRHRDLVEGISSIQLAVLKALWTDDPDLYPGNENETFHWEVWLRRSAYIDFFSYKSHGLRFDVKRATETDEQFRQRVNKQARDADAKYEGGVKESGGEWFLGSKLQTMGSIHSDTWHGTAASLAERGYVAVYPVGGWWKERKALERWGSQVRYALIISIRTPGAETDIYTPVMNQIKTIVLV